MAKTKIPTAFPVATVTIHFWGKRPHSWTASWVYVEVRAPKGLEREYTERAKDLLTRELRKRQRAGV